MRPRGCLEVLLINANERRGLQGVAHMVKNRGRVSKLIPIIQTLLSKLLSPRSYFNAVTTLARFLPDKFEGRPNQLSSSSHAVPGNFDVDHHRRGAGQSVANARGAGFILPRGASCEGGEGMAWRQCVRSRSDVAAVTGGWPTSSTRFEPDR